MGKSDVAVVSGHGSRAHGIMLAAVVGLTIEPDEEAFYRALGDLWRVPQHGYECVPAVPLHATCALSGMRTPRGIIERIDSTDAERPVVTEQGRFSLRDAGLCE